MTPEMHAAKLARRRERRAANAEAINAERRKRYAEDEEYRQARKNASQRTRDGYSPEQRTEAVNRTRDWEAAHPERTTELKAAARARFAVRHPARVSEHQHAYYVRGGEALRAAKRELKRRWRRDNPEAAAAADLAHHARRTALLAAAFVENVSPLLLLEHHDGVCGICGEDVDPFDFTVDHIIPLTRDGEHSYDNTQPAHRSCNASKGDRLLEEMAA